MKMNYVHHVGLICSDLDRSIYFYHDILGFKFQNEPTGWFEGPELEKGVGGSRSQTSPSLPVG